MRIPRPQLAAAAVLAAFCLAGTAAAQTTVTYRVRTESGSCAIVRDAPSTDAPRLDCLPPGSLVESRASVPFWRAVRLPDGGADGWIAKRFLEEVEAGPEPGVPAPPELPPNAWLELHVIDVGQGDALLLVTPDDGNDGNGWFEGRTILIDGGPSPKAGDQRLWQYLERLAHHGAVLDGLVITHPHDDHFMGAGEVLEHMDVARFYDSGFPDSERPRYSQFMARVRREGANGQPVRLFRGREAFDASDWGRELRVQALWGFPGSREGLGSEGTLINNSSLVLRVEYGEVSFLLTGDLEGKDRDQPSTTTRFGEGLVLQAVGAQGVRSTILKLGHHGSETSTTDQFLAGVQPRFVLISSGRQDFDRRAGRESFLPDQTVIDRICQRLPNVVIYRTDWRDAQQGRVESNDADGDHVIVRTNGRRVEVVDADGQPAPRQPC